MIIKCKCVDGYMGNSNASRYQDEVYGESMRACNPTTKEPKGSHWRCSICGTEHQKGEVEKSGKAQKKK